MHLGGSAATDTGASTFARPVHWQAWPNAYLTAAEPSWPLLTTMVGIQIRSVAGLLDVIPRVCD